MLSYGCGCGCDNTKDLFTSRYRRLPVTRPSHACQCLKNSPVPVPLPVPCPSPCVCVNPCPLESTALPSLSSSGSSGAVTPKGLFPVRIS